MSTIFEYPIGTFTPMGTTQIWSVPYSLVAKDVESPIEVAKLGINGTTANDEEALFEVKNSSAQTVFAVYNKGVRVYVDGGDYKSVKGGFAIGGYGTSKTDPQKLLTISDDSVRFYIRDVGKATKGGFAIGGFDKTKGTGNNTNFFNVSTGADNIIKPSQNRVLWYPLKNAFLTGKVLVEKPDSVGENSFASGFESKSVGDFSQALGYGSISRGNYSTAIGYANLSSGAYSLALGYGNLASGLNSFALGLSCKAKGWNSFALGYGSEALGSYTYAIGFNNKALHGPSYAFGDGTISKAWGATTFGWLTQGLAEHSFTVGSHTIGTSYSSLVLGAANDTTTMHPGTSYGSSYNYWWGDDPVFVIGNGDVSFNGVDWVVNSRKNAFTVLKNGKTGINMNYPTYYLDVKGRTRFMSDGSYTAGHWLTNLAGTTDRAFIGMADENNVGFFGNGLANFGLIMNVDNGNVGIGTTDPSSPLTVVKPVSGHLLYLKNSLNSDFGNGIAIFAGQNGAHSGAQLITFFSPDQTTLGYVSQNSINSVYYSSTSDARLKENIDNTLFTINDLMKIKVRDFNFIKDESKTRMTGFVAQELYEVYPDAVSKPLNDKEYWGVDYGKVTPIIVKSIQDQQHMIESLQEENIQLKAQNENLQARLERIESQMSGK
jgi:hypothetical protein